MAEARRKFDQDFKEGAVRPVRVTGRPIAQVAKDLGINEGTLGKWVNATGGTAATGPSWGRTSGRRGGLCWPLRSVGSLLPTRGTADMSCPDRKLPPP